MMIKRIMIVDDSPIIHNILAKILKGNGYEVCANAKNGDEAVKLYKDLKPDLVFLDITMPVKDGIEALKEIKEADEGSKVIMLTAMGDEKIMQKAEEYGADLFVKKPFDDYKIISAINKIDG